MDNAQNWIDNYGRSPDMSSLKSILPFRFIVGVGTNRALRFSSANGPHQPARPRHQKIEEATRNQEMKNRWKMIQVNGSRKNEKIEKKQSILVNPSNRGTNQWRTSGIETNFDPWVKGLGSDGTPAVEGCRARKPALILKRWKMTDINEKISKLGSNSYFHLKID